MPIPVNKTELLAAMQASADKLLNYLTTIDTSHYHIPSVKGHRAGEIISIHQALSYLCGWHLLVVSWYEKKQSGHAFQMPEEGYGWHQLGELAQKFYADFDSIPTHAIVSTWYASYTRLYKLTEGLLDENLYAQPFYGKHTLGRLIQLNSASPCKSTLIAIRRRRL